MVTYRFDENILIVEYHLTYDFADVRTAFATALADPAFTKGVKLLMDGRASQVFPNPQQMMSRVSLLLNLRTYIKQDCAAVVSNQKHYQLAQNLSNWIKQDGLYLRVFDDFDAARNWLITTAH